MQDPKAKPIEWDSEFLEYLSDHVIDNPKHTAQSKEHYRIVEAMYRKDRDSMKIILWSYHNHQIKYHAVYQDPSEYFTQHTDMYQEIISR